MKEGIKYQLLSIKTEQFATLKGVESTHYGHIVLHTDMNFGIDQKDRIIECRSDIEYKVMDELFMKISVACAFLIETDSWNSIKESGYINFPMILLREIADATIGTTRGVLHGKTENTDFNKFFLPLIDSSKLVPDAIKMELVNS